jgi:hypothetical protein
MTKTENIEEVVERARVWLRAMDAAWENEPDLFRAWGEAYGLYYWTWRGNCAKSITDPTPDWRF